MLCSYQTGTNRQVYSALAMLLKVDLKIISGQHVIETIEPAGSQIKFVRKIKEAHVMFQEINIQFGLLSAVPCQTKHFFRLINASDLPTIL